MLSQTREEKLKQDVYDYCYSHNLDPRILSHTMFKIIKYVYNIAYAEGSLAGERLEKLNPRR